MHDSATTLGSNQIVTFLGTTAAYSDRPRTVEIVETHISWVFLTDQYAYKLKKPVTFDFLDFGTAALRRQACLDELRLNRRLAPDVYLAVLPVTEDVQGALQIAGSGREVDWLVQMRRLPGDMVLDRIIRENRLRSADVRAIAEFLAAFYAKLPAESVGPVEYRQALYRHIRANRSSLIQALPEERLRLSRIHSAQLRYLKLQEAEFDSRVHADRIVDGHGDLRPEHIYLAQPPAVIDCLEFSAELRRVDIADELNFLAMECERLGDGGVGDSVLTTYQNVCADQIPATLSSFYRSYRACVRAKVTHLQGQQQPEARRQSVNRLTRQYLDWADYYAEQLGRPCLIVIGGLMGTGKSTLAENLAQAFGMDVLSTDGIRRSKWGTSTSPAAYGEGLYRSETRREVYDELFRRVSRLLDQGQSTIVDGTFLTQAIRNQANDLASRHGAVAVDVLCECPREAALTRIRRRAEAGGSDSEARMELYDAQVQEFEPPNTGIPIVHVDTTVDVSRQVQAVCNGIRDCLSGKK